MKNTEDIHLNVAFPENPVPGLGQEHKYGDVKPHFSNTMYLLYIVLGKWGMVHVGTLWDPDVADVISAIMQILIVSLNFLKERCWLLIKNKRIKTRSC
jgi:hypothetical protein